MKKTVYIVCLIVLAVVLIITAVFAVKIIPTGYSGVKSTLGKIDDKVIPAGVHFKAPFVSKIMKVNNKQQDCQIEEEIWAETSERTALYFKNVTVTYTITPEYSAWICGHVNNYKKDLVSGALVSSAIKTAAKQLSSEEATNRGLIEPLSKECLQESILTKYGNDIVTINRVVIADADFEESYNKTIADKQNAKIAYEQQQIENKKEIEKSEAEKEIKKNKAEADAISKKIEAEAAAEAELIKAEATAEANRMIAESLTNEVLRKMYYEKWDGKLPTVSGDVPVLMDLAE